MALFSTLSLLLFCDLSSLSSQLWSGEVLMLSARERCRATMSPANYHVLWIGAYIVNSYLIHLWNDIKAPIVMHKFKNLWHLEKSLNLILSWLFITNCLCIITNFLILWRFLMDVKAKYLLLEIRMLDVE